MRDSENISEGNELQVYFDSIKEAWCQDTCDTRTQSKWTPEKAYWGQGDVTALLVQEKVGGEIVYNYKLNHYWNIVDGAEFDIAGKFINPQNRPEDRLRIDSRPTREELLQDPDRKYRYQLLKDLVDGNDQ